MTFSTAFGLGFGRMSTLVARALLADKSPISLSSDRLDG